MADIRPFHGLRYRPQAGPLDKLTAPPYDVISPAFREELAARSEHNVVHLTLPESRPDDRSKFVKYARSAATLSAWRGDGTLAPEPRPAFYRYVQRFSLPGQAQPLERTSFIALIKVEPYARGVVLPHEQTFPKHKEDRLRILEATRSHLECIFGLYEDPDGAALAALKSAPAEASLATRSDDGVEQRLEPIVDPAACAELSRQLADKKVWIADGHHRYETALAFREALGERDGPVAEDYMMMALSSMSDPGLVLLPTHRIVRQLPIEQPELLRRLAAHFDLIPTQNRALLPAVEKLRAEGRQGLGLALRGGGGYVLVAHDPAALRALQPGAGGEALRSLDVSTLHGVIFEKLAELPGLDSVSYTRDAEEAAQAPETDAAAAFLMAPPTIEDMRTISLSGEKMPQKSTYYFPKILSGLVLWSLNDFEP